MAGRGRMGRGRRARWIGDRNGLNTLKQAGYVPESYENAPANSETSSKYMRKPEIYSPNPCVYQRVSGYVRNENMSLTGTFSIEPISDISCISVYLRVSGQGWPTGTCGWALGRSRGCVCSTFLFVELVFCMFCFRPPVCRPPGCRLPPARMSVVARPSFFCCCIAVFVRNMVLL